MDANVALSSSGRASLERRSFFFAREVPYGMALLRMVLPWTLMSDMLVRWPHVRELFSADGAPAPLADNFGYPGLLPELPGGLAVALFTLMTLTAITLSVGWRSRLSAALCGGIYTYFGLMDCLSTVTKYTVIASHLFLLLSVSQCGAVWSVDAWIARRRGGPALAENPDAFRYPIWPQRLVQLLIGYVYFGAALTKLHTPAFFAGDQLMYWMMTYINNVHPLGDYLSQYPVVLSIFSYVTIVWEIVFVFCIFHQRLKWGMLAIGAFFHIMTAFTLGLFVFPFVAMSAYCPFLTEAEVTHLLAKPMLRRLSREAAPAATPWPRYASAAAFALVAAFVCLAAVEIEHWMDPYKMRGPGGPLTLREMSEEDVEPLFAPERPIRQSDKVLAFDLGTMVVGEHLLDRRLAFRQGESIIAQVSLSPPHEDMWVDCTLHDAVEKEVDGVVNTIPGKLITKAGQIVAREQFRGNFTFKLDEAFEPGEYLFRLRCGTEEVARRKFTLLPSVKSASAN